MDELMEALRETIDQETGDGLIIAVVDSVDETEYTFDCKDLEGNELFDVRMNATPGETGIIPVPKVGSSVLITDLANKGKEYVMLQAGSVSKVIVYAAGSTRTIFGDKTINLGQYSLEKAVLGDTLNTHLDNLITVMNTLNDVLQALSSTQVAASTGPLAPLAPGFAALSPGIVTVRAQLSLLQQTFPLHLSNTVNIAT